MTKQDIDPELVDDRDNVETESGFFELPEYDPSQFELPDDFEYSEIEEGDYDGDEDEALGSD